MGIKNGVIFPVVCFIILLSTFFFPSDAQRIEVPPPDQQGLLIVLVPSTTRTKVGETFYLTGTVENLTNQTRVIRMTVYSEPPLTPQIISMEPEWGQYMELAPFSKLPFNVTLRVEIAGTYRLGVVVFAPNPTQSRVVVVEVEEDLFRLLWRNLPLLILVSVFAIILGYEPTRGRVKKLLTLSYDAILPHKEEVIGHLAVFIALSSILSFPTLPTEIARPAFQGYLLAVAIGMPSLAVFHGILYKKLVSGAVTMFTPFILFAIGVSAPLRILTVYLFTGTILSSVAVGAAFLAKGNKLGIAILIVSLTLWISLTLPPLLEPTPLG